MSSCGNKKNPPRRGRYAPLSWRCPLPPLLVFRHVENPGSYEIHAQIRKICMTMREVDSSDLAHKYGQRGFNLPRSPPLPTTPPLRFKTYRPDCVREGGGTSPEHHRGMRAWVASKNRERKKNNSDHAHTQSEESLN